jgi:hypothetical protein
METERLTNLRFSELQWRRAFPLKDTVDEDAVFAVAGEVKISGLQPTS